MSQENMQFRDELQSALGHLDHDRELPLAQRLKGPFLRRFTALPSGVVPAKFRPQYLVLKNRLEDFSSSRIDEGEESARQIERQLRGLLESICATSSG